MPNGANDCPAVDTPAMLRPLFEADGNTCRWLVPCRFCPTQKEPGNHWEMGSGKGVVAMEFMFRQPKGDVKTRKDNLTPAHTCTMQAAR